MPDLFAINLHLQERLEQDCREEVGVVEAAGWLDEVRLLPDRKNGLAVCKRPLRQETGGVRGSTPPPARRFHGFAERLLPLATVPSGRGILRLAAEFGARRRRIAAHCGHSPPSPVRAITA